METIRELRKQYFELRRQLESAEGVKLESIKEKVRELTAKLQKHESMIGTSNGNSMFGCYKKAH